jgi:hypothetical protein
VRFSPDGGRIAVGYRGQARVDVLSGKDLTALYQPATASIDSGDLAAVAWSDDGSQLYAAGTFRLKGSAAVRRWTGGGRGAPADAVVPAGEVVSLEGLPRATEPPDPRPEVLTRRLVLTRLAPQGGVAFASADAALGVVLADWKRVRLSGRPPARVDAAELAVDLTGTRVRLAYTSGEPATFSVSEHALSPNPAPDSRLRRPVLSAPGLDVQRAADSGQVLLNGAALALPGQERARGLAVDPEGRRVLVGTERSLQLFDGDGRPVWQAEAPAAVAAVAFSGDRRLAVAALADGTVRWLAAADGKALLALLPHGDRRRWVAWTPSGYYDASADGDDLIGWYLERGPGQAADFFRASLLRDHLRRPDVIDRVLFTLDERRAREEADAESGRTQPPQPLRRLLPPLVRILSPTDGAAVAHGQVTLRVALRSPSGEPIVGLRALVHGRRVQTRTALLQEAGPGRGIPEGVRTVTVAVPSEDCTVVFVAETAHSASEGAAVRLRWSGPPDQKIESQPDLYLLAVGISGYQQGRLRLEYAAKDARDLEAALRAQAGRAYRRVEARVLTDREATRGGILAGMKWLGARASPTDVSVLFLAGHGTSDATGGRYFFLPYEADPLDLGRTALAAGELQQGLRRISGKVLLFLDTCHAGNVLDPHSRGAADLRRLASELASVESGVVVYAASSGGQLSQESPRWGNGAFTKALVEGLRGKADYGQTGRITVSTLEHYISERVRALTREEQVPSLARPLTLPDFLVARTVRPLHRRWWFWGALGVVTAGAVTGALLGTEPWRPKPKTIEAEF